MEPPAGSPQLSFRPLTRAHFPLLQKWLAAPHVAVWWNEPFDLASLESKYGPAIDRQEPIHVYLIELNAAPIGWIQWYRWRHYPEHAAALDAGSHAAGLDLAIGEPALTGLGLGPAVLQQFVANYVLVHPDIQAVVADPAAANRNSVRAFQKAGFRPVRPVRLAQEQFDRLVVRLEFPTAKYAPTLDFP